MNFMSALETMSNSTPSLPDTKDSMSNILGIDQYIWDEENFNRAAINPASFLESRKKAIELLKKEVDQEYNAWIDVNAPGYDMRGKQLSEHLPRKQKVEIAKQAALSLYASRMNIINQMYPTKFVDKSKDRVIKANSSSDKDKDTYKTDDLNISIDYKLMENKILENNILENKKPK